MQARFGTEIGGKEMISTFRPVVTVCTCNLADTVSPNTRLPQVSERRDDPRVCNSVRGLMLRGGIAWKP